MLPAPRLAGESDRGEASGVKDESSSNDSALLRHTRQAAAVASSMTGARQMLLPWLPWLPWLQLLPSASGCPGAPSRRPCSPCCTLLSPSFPAAIAGAAIVVGGGGVCAAWVCCCSNDDDDDDDITGAGAEGS